MYSYTHAFCTSAVFPVFLNYRPCAAAMLLHCRLRVRDINEAFKELGHMLSLHTGNGQPMTKLMILQQAVGVITQLEQQVRGNPPPPPPPAQQQQQQQHVTRRPAQPISDAPRVRRPVPAALPPTTATVHVYFVDNECISVFV